MIDLTETNKEIEQCQDRLNELYRFRAGEIDSVTEIGYCCMCGKYSVDYENGYDTCFICLSNF